MVDIRVIVSNIWYAVIRKKKFVRIVAVRGSSIWWLAIRTNRTFCSKPVAFASKT